MYLKTSLPLALYKRKISFNEFSFSEFSFNEFSFNKFSFSEFSFNEFSFNEFPAPMFCFASATSSSSAVA
jgi:hypothetical protein